MHCKLGFSQVVCRVIFVGFMKQISNFSASDLTSDGQRALYAWYGDIAARGEMPARADFDPLDFPAALPFLVLVNIEASPRRYRTRLVGTQVVEANGRDGTGHYFDETAGTEAAVERIEAVVAGRRPIFSTDVPMTWSPKDYKNYSVLSLPLSSDGTTINMIMYCLDFR